MHKGNRIVGVRTTANLSDGRHFSATADGLIGPTSGEWTIGKNVPWSVSWTGEQSFDLHISEDFPGLMEVVQIQRPGDGSPRFAAQHVTRHRRGMTTHLCHVCGRRTLKGDRYIFPVQSGGMVTVENLQRYAGNVPPVHLACAKRAQQLCPHLSHSFAQPMAYPSEDSMLLPRTDVAPGMEELAKALPSGVKVVFTCVRLYGPRFSKRVEKLRREHEGS